MHFVTKYILSTELYPPSSIRIEKIDGRIDPERSARINTFYDQLISIYTFSPILSILSLNFLLAKKIKWRIKIGRISLPRWYPWSLRWFLTDGKPRTRDFKEKTRKSLRTVVTGRKFPRKLCPNSVNSAEDDVEIDKSTTRNRENALIFCVFFKFNKRVSLNIFLFFFFFYDDRYRKTKNLWNISKI